MGAQWIELVSQLGYIIHTPGSALLVILYHSAANTVGIFFHPMFSGPDLVTYQWLLTSVTWVAAVIVILATGPTLQRRPTALSMEAAYVDEPLMAA